MQATKNLDDQELAERIQNIDWETYYGIEDVDECWTFIYDNLISILDDLCPEKTYNNISRRSEWVSSALFELMHKRNHQFKRAKLLKDPDLWDEARSTRNLVNDACKQAKNEYVIDKLSENEGNSRKFWSQLKPLCKETNSNNRENIELINSATGIPYNEEMVPEVFNKFFSNIGIELKQKITELSKTEKKTLDSKITPDVPQLSQPNHVPIFKFRLVNDLAIGELIKRIKVHKSSGIPRVSSYLLKLSFKHMTPQIAHLINKSLETNTVPIHCKSVVITPVFKAGDPRTPGNYRPISTLPITSKLLEKIVHIQLSEHLERNNLLSNNQFGFRTNYSNTKAISTLLNDLYNNINNNKYTKLCYIDLKKAFDTVCHNTLYSKLESVGVTGEEIRWFKNYLLGRSQTVKANGCRWGGGGCPVWCSAGQHAGPPPVPDLH